MSRECHLARSDIDVLAVILVGPSSVVSNDMGGFHDIEPSCDLSQHGAIGRNIKKRDGDGRLGIRSDPYNPRSK